MSARDVIARAVLDAIALPHLLTAQGVATADAIISDLRSAGYVIERDWQSIETAPRDGTRFHAWMPPHGGMMTGGGTVADCCWHLGGWHHPYFTEPTHWRPLPAPPKETPDAT